MPFNQKTELKKASVFFVRVGVSKSFSPRRAWAIISTLFCWFTTSQALKFCSSIPSTLSSYKMARTATSIVAKLLMLDPAASTAVRAVVNERE